jgi:hypothetical protein
VDWKVIVIKNGKAIAKKSGLKFETVIAVLDILDGLFKANNPAKIFTEIIAEPKKK